MAVICRDPMEWAGPGDGQANRTMETQSETREFFDEMGVHLKRCRGWFGKWRLGIALMRWARPWDLKKPLPLKEPYRFRRELVRYGQGADVYRHLLFHSGCQLLGPPGWILSWAADWLDRRQAARGRKESITEVVNNLAGREMGRLLAEGISSGANWEDVRHSISTLVEEPGSTMAS